MALERIPDQIMETDLLIIGGGAGGCVAALRAVESGMKVLLWEKAGILRSGSASVGIRSIRNVLPPELSLEEVAERISKGELIGGEERLFRGIVDENILYAGYRDCWDLVKDLERWGIDFHWKGEEYNLQFYSRTGARTNLRFRGGADLKKNLALKVLSSPVTVGERIMAIDLVTEGERVAGATGLNIRSGEFVAAKAKAVLLSTGSVVRLYHPLGGVATGRFKMIYTHAPSPGDGSAMAFRAGAELVNMEVIYEGGGVGTISPHPYDSLCTRTGPLLGRDGKAPIVNARGEQLGEGRVDGESILKEEEEGRGPCYIDPTSLPEEIHERMADAKKDAQPISAQFIKERGFDTRTHKFELLPYRGNRLECCLAGIKIDEHTRTSVKGLYAAGDNVGGTTYDGLGGAMVFARKAAIEAGAYIQNLKETPLNEDQVAASKEQVIAPLRVKDGVAPLELEMKIRDILERYCGAFRSEGRITQGLWRLNSVKEKFLSQLQARTPHELMNVQGAKNLLLLAEIHLQSARERKESKPGNWRIDYPDKKHDPWKKSVIAQKEGEEIQIFQKELPALKPEYRGK
ncbi:MAG: FAD-binding protein [Pseudomonadota bacterium]